MKKSGKNGQTRPKTAKIDVLRAKKWFYVIGTFFWHILAKIKINPWTVFFLSQSLKNPEITSILPLTSIFLAKTAKIGQKTALNGPFGGTEGVKK